MPKTTLDPTLEAKLIETVKKRDLAGFNELLKAGFDLDAPLKNAGNRTPLSFAEYSRAKDIVYALLKAGADPARGGINLLWALYERDEWAVSHLVSKGADINVRTKYAGPPIVLAAARNLGNIIQILIDAGADVNVGALTKAVSENHTEAVKILLKAGATVPPDDHLLSIAVHKRNNAIALGLIAAGAPLNENKAMLYEPDLKTGQMRRVHELAAPLIVAASTGQHELVQALIGARADLYAKDMQGATALDRAKEKNDGASSTLLEAAMKKSPPKANPSADLIFAAEKGDVSLVKQLLKQEADPNVRDDRPKMKGLTPLMLAARNNHVEVAMALLDAGADVKLRDDTDSSDEQGFNFFYSEHGLSGILEIGTPMFRTPLHWAAGAPSPEIAHMLIEHGADIHATDRARMTPLVIASISGSLPIVNELLRAGADPNVEVKKKDNALIWAARNGHVEVAKALLAAGAKIKAKNDTGNTALHAAAGGAHADAVEVLLAAGADLNVLNRDKEMPIHRVCSHRLWRDGYVKGVGTTIVFERPEAEIMRTIKLLIEAGADPNAQDKHGLSALYLVRRIAAREIPFFIELVALLEKAKPREPAPSPPAKKAAPKAQPKPKKATEEDEEFVPPSFAKAAKSKEFESALADLEKLAGSKRHPMNQVEGGFTLHLHSSKKTSFDLEKVQEDYLKRGCFVFSTDQGSADAIGALPTIDKFDVLLAMGTNGQNYDLMPQDVVDWMKKLDKEQPFIITAAGFDFVAGKFTSKIVKPAQLAKRMCDFCPDFDGEVKALAEQLKSSSALFFWWD